MPVEGNANTNEGAGAIRTELDQGALAVWLEANVAGYHGPLSVDQFNGGQSNPTCPLTTPTAHTTFKVGGKPRTSK